MKKERTAYDILKEALTQAYKEGIIFKHKNTGDKYRYMGGVEFSEAPFMFLNISRGRSEGFKGKELAKLVCIVPKAKSVLEDLAVEGE